MPYCSIEEAWGSTFSSKKKTQDTNYSNIVPDNANNDLNEYSDIEFDNDNVYTNTGKPVLTKPNEKKKKRRKSFSRTMNRLPNTSGPNNRYVHGNNHKQLKLSDNSKSKKIPTKLLKDQKKPSYKNLDTPISSYNKDVRQDLYDNQSISNISLDNYDEGSSTEETPNVYDDIYNDEYNDEEHDIYQDETSDEDIGNKNIKLVGRHLRTTKKNHYHLDNTSNQENDQRESYKDIDISELETQRANRMRDNMFDIIVYVITGIFLIFILDLFVRLGKNSRV